jgi:predicted porin
MKQIDERKRGIPWVAASLTMASILVGTPAFAADLGGGDCCADLEERVAELEATTARKGNRKVSLTISGWVTNQIMYWDDGNEQNAYVVDTLEDVGSRLHFDGQAQINSRWSAGYALRLNVKGTNGFQVDQDTDDAGAGINLLNSYWWIKSKDYGRLAVGRQSSATDNIFVDLSGAGSIFAANLVIFDGASFRLRPKDGNSGPAGLSPTASWSTLGHCYTIGVGIFADCHGGRDEAVRWDSPTVAGFVLSASWGEDDFYDVALRYTGEAAGFKSAFSGGVSEERDSTRSGGDQDARYWQVAGSVLHEPTGLFIVASSGYEEPLQAPGFPDGFNVYVKAGIRAKLNKLGATVFYGEYGRSEDAYGAIAESGAACAGFSGVGGAIDAACLSDVDTSVSITGSSFDRWGVGVVQEIDAASMALWLKFKQNQADADFFDAKTGDSGTQDFEDLNIVAFGGAIFF